MPKEESKAKGGGKVFVRGPDGSLYILTKDKPPYKLNAAEKKITERILNDAQDLVEKSLKAEASQFGSMVNVHVPSFPGFP
jgi:hypothetical protein